MSIISVSCDAAGRHEELASFIANHFSAELLTEAGLARAIDEVFPETEIPARAWQHAVRLILAMRSAKRHVILCAPNVARALQDFPCVLRVTIVSRSGGRLRYADLLINEQTFSPPQTVEILETALRSRGLLKQPADGAGESEVEFQARLQLAKFGLAPPQSGPGTVPPLPHASEQLFANLLDFYRIRWEYEPRTFPLQWDKSGKVLEAFTPDFYLPEVDLYVELTTMRQSLVTRKNRKVRLLRAIYPHVNIQVFYQKDFQELVSKYGLADRVAE